MGSIYDRLAINLGAVAGSNGRSEESPPISVGWGREGVTGGGGRGRVGGGAEATPNLGPFCRVCVTHR